MRRARKDKASSKRNTTTTKRLVAFLFVNCTVIELFTMFCEVMSIMISFKSGIGITPDFSPLVALIGAVIGETIGFAIYSVKSTKENTKGGVVYETVMQDIGKSDQNING